jgi:hypothetical protein
MVVPVGDMRLLARQRRKLALQEIAEAEAGGIDIAAVADQTKYIGTSSI